MTLQAMPMIILYHGLLDSNELRSPAGGESHEPDPVLQMIGLLQLAVLTGECYKCELAP